MMDKSVVYGYILLQNYNDCRGYVLVYSNLQSGRGVLMKTHNQLFISNYANNGLGHDLAAPHSMVGAKHRAAIVQVNDPHLRLLGPAAHTCQWCGFES